MNQLWYAMPAMTCWNKDLERRTRFTHVAGVGPHTACITTHNRSKQLSVCPPTYHVAADVHQARFTKSAMVGCRHTVMVHHMV